MSPEATHSTYRLDRGLVEELLAADQLLTTAAADLAAAEESAHAHAIRRQRIAAAIAAYEAEPCQVAPQLPRKGKQ